MTTPDEDQLNLTDATRDAEREDEKVHSHADRDPTADEEAAAPTSVDPKAAQAYEEAIERGAKVKGEGEI